MLKPTVEGVDTHLSPDVEKYTKKRIAALEKYIPRRARKIARANVVLRKVPSKDKNKFACEITMRLPHEIINSRETTERFYAAVDVATAKMQHQLQRYKDEYGSPKLHRRLINRLRGRHTIQSI